MQTPKQFKTRIKWRWHCTWWFEPSQLDHLLKSKRHIQHQSYSINMTYENTLWSDNAYMLLTWFPDVAFKEKLTKLSFLKLSKRQKHTKLYLKFAFVFQDQNICLCKAKPWDKYIHATQSTIQGKLYKTKCKKYAWQKNIMRVLSIKSFGSFYMQISFICPSVYEQSISFNHQPG